MKRFVDLIKTSNNHPIHLIQCKDAAGINCFYFLQCEAYKIRQMNEHSNASVKISDYAVILRSGYGNAPSQADWHYMQEHHGFWQDH